MFGFRRNKKNEAEKPKDKIWDKVLMGAIIGGAIGSVIGAKSSDEKDSKQEVIDSAKVVAKEAKKGSTWVFKKVKALVEKQINKRKEEAPKKIPTEHE